MTALTAAFIGLLGGVLAISLFGIIAARKASADRKSVQLRQRIGIALQQSHDENRETPPNQDKNEPPRKIWDDFAKTSGQTSQSELAGK